MGVDAGLADSSSVLMRNRVPSRVTSYRSMRYARVPGRSNLHASDVSALMFGVASLPKPPAAETGYRLIRLPAAFPQASRVWPG